MSSPEESGAATAFARVTAFAAIAGGVIVLAGWAADLAPLTSIVPGWPPMPRLAALAFVFTGLALWLVASGSRRVAGLFAAITLAIGLLVLTRYVFRWSIYLDQFSLGRIPDEATTGPVPRMAIGAALGFTLLGASLLLANLRRAAVLHQSLAILALLAGWLGLSRYVFRGDPLIPFYNMALHSALLLVALACGLLTLRRDAGIASLLSSEGVGGRMARRLLPWAIGVPLAVGWISVMLVRRGTLGVEAAVSVFALCTVVVFVGMVWGNAARVERNDRMRRRAETALRASEERHQLMVETALDAVITMDRHGIVAGWNTQAEKTFGWPRAEALGRPLAELIVPERHREAHDQGMQRYISSGVARVLNRRVEMTALHRDGREIPVELSITPIGFGEELVFNAFVRDITARARSEAQLRESEQRFRSTADSAPVHIWMSGTDKLLTWFNKRRLEFVGRTMEQEIGNGWADNVHPADFDRALDTYARAFDERREFEVEYRLQRRDAAWRWMLVRGLPNFAPNGEFQGYIGTCMDITEHREAVEQLRESRARFKTVTESLPQLVWTCTREGYCDYLSRQWLEYTGRPEAEQQGSGWTECMHPDDRARVQAAWAAAVATGSDYDVTFRIRRHDGVYRWFKTRAVPLRDPAGRILKWFGSNTDIEDFMVAEQRLQVQLARMQLLDRTTHAIGEHQTLNAVFEVVLHSLERNLHVDFCCACLYQSEPEQLIVTSVGAKSLALAKELGLIENAKIDIDQNALSRCVRGELVYEPDVREIQSPFPQRLARGELRALVLAPLVVESEVFGIMIVARSVVDAFGSGDCEFLRQLSGHVALAAHQARLYTALQTAYQDLRETQQTVMQQERLRALGQIASGVAHDINNALSPAALYAQSLITHEASLSDRAREHLAVIQRAIDDVARTVTRMRAFYMPRGLELTLSPVDVNQVLVQVIDLTRARWSNMPQERGVVVHVESDLQPELPLILGAENEIRDALTNLLLNAVDAMPEGGTVTLRTRHVPRDNQIVVDVNDTGVGMSETTRSRCLEPFFTTKGERGTGLGLPMVFGMAQRHGGELEIDSELGRGTTMRIVFPVAPTAISVREQEVALPRAKLRILLVDDDPLLLKSLRDALELDEHEVITAEGGQAGIDAFADAQRRGERIDAVITDLGMPYVDGRAVASRIRALEPKVPMLMLTGWGHRLLASADLPEHVDRVLSKPPKMAEIRSALAEYAGKRTS
jgi:PAS domain S-box-containing protein